MSKITKGSFELMKKMNVIAILKILRQNESLSRADIAKLSGLTPATVTNITKVLIEEDILVEQYIGESNGGRPPVMLKIKPNARYIISINIGAGTLEVGIVNLCGEIICRYFDKIDKENIDLEGNFENLIKIINKVIQNSEIDKLKILGIGVAMHGIVNSKEGISKHAPYYDWKDINIREMLESKLNYKVFVDNDVRAMALAESYFGKMKNINNFIVLNVSNGIGAGIIINNKLHCGVDFSAGEIGHIVVNEDGNKCNCGNYGCLETISSNDNIIKEIRMSLKRGESSILLKNKDIENISIENICEAVSLDDKLCIDVIKSASNYIGICISNIVNILNPQQIVVIGELFEKNDYSIDVLREVVKRRGCKQSVKNIKITKSFLNKDSAIIGAATLVIEEFFNGTEFTIV